MRFYSVFTLILMTYAAFTWAHGNGRPGPHGGHIQMPGAFHTELVIAEGLARVYLLDMAFRDPTTHQSSVVVSLSNSSDKPPSCAPKENFFHCQLPKDWSKASTLTIAATRKGLKGRAAVYKLPLAFSATGAVAPAKPSEHTHQH